MLNAYFQLMSSSKKTKIVHPEEKELYVCDNCGPFVLVITEVWYEQSDDKAQAILFKEHNMEKKCVEVVGEIEISKKKDGLKLEINYCGYCMSLIKCKYPTTWKQKVGSAIMGKF